MKLPRHWYSMSTNFFDSIGYGILMPVLPELLGQLTEASAIETASVAMLLTVCYAGMQFLFGPMLGNLSDRFGRRPVLLVMGAILAADYLIMAWAPTLAWLFIGRIAAGVAGSTISVAYASAADVSTPENKAANFGLMSAAFGAGFVFGPVLGGFLGEFGPRVPFLAAGLLIGLNCLIGVFFYRETLPSAIRRPMDWWGSNPFSTLLNLRKVRDALPILGADFGYAFVFGVYPAVWSYFARAAVDWDLRQVSISLALYGASYVLVQALIVPRVIARVGLRQTFYWGLGFQALALLGLTMIPVGWLIYASIPIAALGGLCIPALTTMLSNSVDRTRQGQVQGVAKSLFAIASVATPLVALGSFSYFTSDAAPFRWPGAPFAAVLLAMPLVAMMIARVKHPNGRPEPESKPAT